MKIKSLLLGSAVAAVAVTGARAADAIIIAEPEPMEYVRICDVYGAGFFYIPGTQNCLKIGGYVRYQMDYNQGANRASGYSFSKLARFAPNFDVRNETELGTLRGYAELEFDWTSTSGATATNLAAAYIELQQANTVLRIGKGPNPYARFLSFGAGGVYGGTYGYSETGEVSFTYNNGNGFSAVVAAIESGTGKFEPHAEGGVNFAQGWGSVGAMAGYDNVENEWGAKVVVRGNVGPVAVGLHGFYSSTTGDNRYGMANPHGGTSEWSVLAHATVALNEKVAVKGHVQWFDGTPQTGNEDVWQGVAGLNLTPVPGLSIRPEVRYTTKATHPLDGPQKANWTAALRFDRSF